MSKPEYFTRHFDLIPAEAYDKKIIVVGAGAIGSFTVLSLAKMGYRNIHVYDFDTIEPENISSQFYPTNRVGVLKVVALKEMIWNFTGIAVAMVPEAVTPETKLSCDILISAVDSMSVRKMLFEIANCHYLIDPRMGAEYASMNTVTMKNRAERENYAKSLFSDAEAVQERCTAKTTIYTVFLIAGQVMKAVKDITTGSEPISSLDWSIKHNALVAFSNGRKL